LSPGVQVDLREHSETQSLKKISLHKRQTPLATKVAESKKKKKKKKPTSFLMGPSETLKKRIKNRKRECVLGSTSHEISQAEGCRGLPSKLQ
jgi:hypothetical protein